MQGETVIQISGETPKCFNIASVNMRDDRLVLNPEPRLGLSGRLAKKQGKKEDLLGNGIDGIEHRDVMLVAKAIDEVAEDNGMRVPCGIRRQS